MMGSKQETFEEILYRLNQQGNIEVAVLSTKDDMPLGSFPDHYEDKMAAAMVTLLNEAAYKINQELNLSQMDEISIVGDDRTRLVCRYFAVNGRELLLTVLAPLTNPIVGSPTKRYRLSNAFGCPDLTA